MRPATAGRLTHSGPPGGARPALPSHRPRPARAATRTARRTAAAPENEANTTPTSPTPAVPDPAPFFWTPIAVRDSELDQYAVVNNAVYPVYLEHARHRWLAAAGLESAAEAAVGGKGALALSELSLRFLAPLRPPPPAWCASSGWSWWSGVGGPPAPRRSSSSRRPRRLSPWTPPTSPAAFRRACGPRWRRGVRRVVGTAGAVEARCRGTATDGKKKNVEKKSCVCG